MANYIDGFVFPVAKDHLKQYQEVATDVAAIWKEHGALSYYEYVDDGLTMEGIQSFPQTLDLKEDEVVIFGWVVFDSKETRDRAHKLVASDKRMITLIAPIMNPEKPIFNARRMVYGAFRPLVQLK